MTEYDITSRYEHLKREHFSLIMYLVFNDHSNNEGTASHPNIYLFGESTSRQSFYPHMSTMRKAVLQSILTNDLFSCSPHRVIIFPINVKASTCLASQMIQVSIIYSICPRYLTFSTNTLKLGTAAGSIMKCLAHCRENTTLFFW